MPRSVNEERDRSYLTDIIQLDEPFYQATHKPVNGLQLYQSLLNCISISDEQTLIS